MFPYFDILITTNRLFNSQLNARAYLGEKKAEDPECGTAHVIERTHHSAHELVRALALNLAGLERAHTRRRQLYVLMHRACCKKPMQKDRADVSLRTRVKSTEQKRINTDRTTINCTKKKKKQIIAAGTVKTPTKDED